MVLGFFGPGSVLGLDANILGRVHATTAEAVQQTEVVVVPRRELLNEIQNNATAAWQVAQLVSENCYFLRDILASFQLAESAPQKVARCLLLLIPAGRLDGQGQHLNLSQEVIAQMVGVTRETVSRQLARFRKNGLLTGNRSELAICDRRALETLADLPEAVA
jgi:CRP-like cAMP-binding protein